MIAIGSFLPDADPTSEGVLLDCENLLPTNKGYKGAPAPSAYSSALAAECRGAVTVLKLDNSTRTFAGSQTKLYELNGTSWTDRSRVGDYTGSTDSIWRYIQWGDVTIAFNGVDATQYSTSAAFADIAGAPKAVCGDAVDGFVMLANYNDGTDTRDGIFWSAYLDYSDWTPDVATQCGNLRLYDTPGEIRALKALNKTPIVYKARATYIGVNYGPPSLWGFQLLSKDVGAYSQEAVLNIGNAHLFWGDSGVYACDGASVYPIDQGIHDWLMGDLHPNFSYKIRGFHDKDNQRVYWYYPNRSSTGELNSCIVYHYTSKRWGRANRVVECPLEFISGALTYASFEAAYATYADIPSVSYGAPFWTNGAFNLAYFDSSHVLQILNQASASCSYTSGYIGDDSTMSLITRVQPRFTVAPTTGSMVNYYSMNNGISFTTDATTTMSNYRFDVIRSARWHKAKISYTGDVEVTGHAFSIKQSGIE